MSLLDLIKTDYQLYTDIPVLPENCVYLWANSKCILGIGRWHSGEISNKRVNPKLDKLKVKNTKDAGKSFCAYYAQCKTKESMSLYIREDMSDQHSRNSSKLEVSEKAKLTKNKFMVYNSSFYEKVDFMDNVIHKEIYDYFGKDSMEEIFTKIAAGDGDLWSRFSRHEQGKISLDKILNFIESF